MFSRVHSLLTYPTLSFLMEPKMDLSSLHYNNTKKENKNKHFLKKTREDSHDETPNNVPPGHSPPAGYNRFHRPDFFFEFLKNLFSFLTVIINIHKKRI